MILGQFPTARNSSRLLSYRIKGKDNLFATHQVKCPIPGPKQFEHTLPHQVQFPTLNTSHYVLRSSFVLHIQIIKEDVRSRRIDQDIGRAHQSSFYWLGEMKTRLCQFPRIFSSVSLELAQFPPSYTCTSHPYIFVL